MGKRITGFVSLVLASLALQAGAPALSYAAAPQAQTPQIQNGGHPAEDYGVGGDELAQFQRLLASPAVQAYLRFFKNPAFSDGINDVFRNPNKKTLLYWELALALFLIVFRAWRLSKVTHWARRLWVKFYSFAAYSTLSVVVLPSIIMGVPYVRLLTGFVEVLIHQ
jgi:hypothetical protein